MDAYLSSFDIFTDTGLIEVSTAEAQRRKIAPFTLFDPCANLRIGWQILQDDYGIEVKHDGPGQTALEHAISRFAVYPPRESTDRRFVLLQPIFVLGNADYHSPSGEETFNDRSGFEPRL